ncbi:MAG: hypothetical protein DWQ47_09775 [Acidobacteria bacterium]|nr:MAG: hypothetical protein DWQ32_12190 [Acidobacteriota bacterium]REJ98722.1 MAG: hypothetical protein DWQ38_15290 [Acidobacteriota bacterium]REK16623.1 MAG: hypothetical protein DWQ43_00035 [Acidobacteriota bacterium]REK42534.1 MAG: hypothetical protein DWQ47_09775 [Acidobacteriota bacterium]
MMIAVCLCRDKAYEQPDPGKSSKQKGIIEGERRLDMNSYRNISAALSIAAMILGLTVLVSAQRRNSQYDPYYGRNTSNINYAVRNLRDNARRFQDTLDRTLDRSRLDGTNREDYLNDLASKFKNAAEDLDDEYEGRGSRRSSSDEARRVVQYGAELDNALSRSRIGYNNYTLMSSWAAIERDLATVARTYNIGYYGMYGRGNRGPVRGNRGGNVGRYPGRVGNRGVYNRNLRSTIVRLKNNARRFEDRIDDIDDRDRWGRNTYSNNLESLTDRFKNAVDRLEDEYENRRDYNDSYNEVRDVLNLGAQVDRELSRARVGRSIRNDWSRIESDLRVLANAYNIRYDGRSRYGIGDIFRNFPF